MYHISRDGQVGLRFRNVEIFSKEIQSRKIYLGGQRRKEGSHGRTEHDASFLPCREDGVFGCSIFFHRLLTGRFRVWWYHLHGLLAGLVLNVCGHGDVVVCCDFCGLFGNHWLDEKSTLIRTWYLFITIDRHIASRSAPVTADECRILQQGRFSSAEEGTFCCMCLARLYGVPAVSGLGTDVG